MKTCCVCVCVCPVGLMFENPQAKSTQFGVKRRIYIHVLVVTADSIKH